jgi:hypothetical protein
MSSLVTKVPRHVNHKPWATSNIGLTLTGAGHRRLAEGPVFVPIALSPYRRPQGALVPGDGDLGPQVRSFLHAGSLPPRLFGVQVRRVRPREMTSAGLAVHASKERTEVL